MNNLRLSAELSIPAEALTQTFGILAKRGTGKTYTALVLAEEMFRVGQVVVVDPVGVCWGLRSSADGQKPGLPIVVLGGEHGDIELEPTVGKTIADFVVESGQSLVLDLSPFSNDETVRFMTDFAERLYQRKAKDRRPLHLFLDESDTFCPQQPLPGEKRMMGAVDKIVRRGRARGLGVTLITQRPAVIHKNVLTQIECLIALRTVAPQDRKAIETWVEAHGTSQERERLMASLPSLPIGTAWFWSPGWLNLFQKVQIRQRFTFDSSATPEVGTLPTFPQTLAPVELSLLQQRIRAAAQVDSSGSDSQQLRQLRQRITELEQQLEVKPVERVEVPVFQDGELQKLEAALESLLEFGHRAISVAEDMALALQKIAPAQSLPEPLLDLPPQPSPVESADEAIAKASHEPSRPQQRILDALVEFEALGLSVVARHNLAVFSDQSPTSSGFTNNLGWLRTQGLIKYPVSGQVCLTSGGRQKARASFGFKSVEDLHNAWYVKLSKPRAAIVSYLIQLYPQAIDKELLARKVGRSPTSSGYTNNLGSLRSLGLIDYPQPGQVVATSLLFPPELQQ